MLSNFIKGTLVLTIAGFVVKAIGSINWILLSRVLGGEGIGIYQMAFPIYLLALQVSSAGIPIAISIVTAEKLARRDLHGAKQVFSISMTFLTITGLLCSLLIYFGAPYLIEEGYIIEPRAYYSLLALAPAIFFVTLISGYRGYLQGWQMMTPTAVSQIIEQLLRVVIMLSAAYVLLPYGLGEAAGGASLGAGIGAVGALLCLYYYYRKLPKELPPVDEETLSPIKKAHQSNREILWRLIKLAIPISLASLMLPLVANLDLFIVPRRLLVAGFSTDEATELFGYLTGMAIPLINLATIITAAMATSVVPSISSLVSKRDKKGIYERAAGSMQLTFVATVPFSVILYILAEPVVTFIYNAPKAATATQILAIAIFFLGVHQVTTGILQGLGQPRIPVVNMGIAAAIKVTMNWFLVAIPWLGIAGASYATIADIAFAAMLNLIYIKKYTGYFMDMALLGKNIISAAIMGILMFYLHEWLLTFNIHLVLDILITASVGMIIYLVTMIAMKGISVEDLKRMPLVNRFIK